MGDKTMNVRHGKRLNRMEFVKKKINRLHIDTGNVTI